MNPTFLAFPNDVEPWLLTRAYLAAILGPSRRASFGQTRKFVAPINTPVELARCSGDQVLFVSVRMVVGQLTAFGPSNDIGISNSIVDPLGVLNAVLLPGESLFGSNTGAPDEFVVTQVRF
ncbi:MAG: hypothetical protein HC882_00335 [Acidobacteria bacterium]|nr:hypothetical protein [Acidobacteriota bacterium]